MCLVAISCAVCLVATIARHTAQEIGCDYRYAFKILIGRHITHAFQQSCQKSPDPDRGNVKVEYSCVLAPFSHEHVLVMLKSNIVHVFSISAREMESDCRFILIMCIAMHCLLN